MTKLTSVRKAPPGWGKDPNYVYIGRAGHGLSGFFGNPFSGPRVEVIDQYRRHFLRRLDTEPGFREAVLALRGKTLVCFCHPLPCHGDVIIEWLDQNGDT